MVVIQFLKQTLEDEAVKHLSEVTRDRDLETGIAFSRATSCVQPQYKTPPAPQTLSCINHNGMYSF